MQCNETSSHSGSSGGKPCGDTDKVLVELENQKPVNFQEAYSMHGNEMSLGHRGEPYCIVWLARCRDWWKAVCLERRWFQRIVRTLSSRDAGRFGDSFNCLYWRCVHQELHCTIWSFLPTWLHLLYCALLHNCRGLSIPTHLYWKGT